MSPRVILKTDCIYAECEEYISSRRGILMRTIVCRHEEHDGCLCMLDPRVGGVCLLREERDEEQEEED